MDRFIRFPWQVYRHDPNWVPPLISERRAFLDRRRNPFFEHAEVRLLLASDEAGRLRGRIAAIVNHRHIELHGEKVGFFGLFECEHDREAAAALFGAAAEFLKSRGLAVMRGPENLSVNDDIGLLVDGFDSPPAIMMPFNRPYYPALVESCGLRKTKDLYAYYADAREPRMRDRITRGMELCRRRCQCQVRPVDRGSGDDLDAVYRVYTQAWARNWGAVALTRKEFDHLVAQFNGAVDPDLFLIATIGGEVAGFSLALPDLNQVLIRLDGKLSPIGMLKLLWYRRKIDMIRIVTMGIVEKFRHRGVDSSLYHETWRRATAKGVFRGELSWVLEDNAAMNNVLRNLGLRAYKRYRLYSLGL
jgi:ribosomal protein S18 acetylase RimI-like enzyme